jgi:hypothetical protein
MNRRASTSSTASGSSDDGDGSENQQKETNSDGGDVSNSASDKDKDNDMVGSPLKKRPRRSMALEFAAELPNLQESVHVVGFPTGGRTICVTEGVVSRIDLSDRIVSIQIDAASKQSTLLYK